MPTRTFFTPENATMGPPLTPADLAILNRAARNIWRPGQQPRLSDLMALRMNYRPGMSAAELVEACEGCLP
jgi:hypothetical protein